MYNFVVLLTLASVATTTLAAADGRRQYRLKTEVKAHQRGKSSYSDLYVVPYHTGAGLNDATFVKNESAAAVGYLNGTSNERLVQAFELPGSETPWYDTKGLLHPINITPANKTQVHGHGLHPSRLRRLATRPHQSWLRWCWQRC